MNDIKLISTQDMYEAAYYLTLGGNVESIEIVKENKKEICQFIVSGENLYQHQLDYFNAKALVNLFDFRRCYLRLHSLIGTAKKEAKLKDREEASL
jgi:hypothetical protein